MQRTRVTHQNILLGLWRSCFLVITVELLSDSDTTHSIAWHHILRWKIGGPIRSCTCRRPGDSRPSYCHWHFPQSIPCRRNSEWATRTLHDECTLLTKSDSLGHLPHSIPQVSARNRTSISSSQSNQILINRTPIRHINPDVRCKIISHQNPQRLMFAL